MLRQSVPLKFSTAESGFKSSTAPRFSWGHVGAILGTILSAYVDDVVNPLKSELERKSNKNAHLWLSGRLCQKYRQGV
jgi:hypothetical protein